MLIRVFNLFLLFVLVLLSIIIYLITYLYNRYRIEDIPTAFFNIVENPFAFLKENYNYILTDYTLYILLAIALTVYVFTRKIPNISIVLKCKDNNCNIDKYKLDDSTKLTHKQIKKAKQLPTKFNFYTSFKDKKLNIKDVKTIDKSQEIKDELYKITPTTLIYRNRSGYINFNNYKNAQEDIKQYLGVDYIEILREQDDKVIIKYRDTLNLKDFVFNPKTMLKPNSIYLGVNRDFEELFIPIQNLTHCFITGQTGSGKSVFQNVMLASLFYNMRLDKQNNTNVIEKVVLIDLKGGVEFYNYKYISNKIEVVDNINDLYDVIDNLVETMHARLTKMKEQGIKNLKSNFIFLIFDEFGQIQDNRPQNDPEALKKWNRLQDQLRSLAALARAAAIRLIITTQRGTSDSIDTTMRDNLPTRVILKQQSIQAVLPMLGGSSEVLDELGVDPKTFRYGRFIFVDATTTFSKGVKYHVAQCPYISEDFYLDYIEDMRLRELLQERNELAQQLNKANASNAKDIQQKLDSVIQEIKKLDDKAYKPEKPKMPKRQIGKGTEEALARLNSKLQPKKQKQEDIVDKYIKLINVRKKLYKHINAIEDKEKRKELRQLYSTIKAKMQTIEKSNKVEIAAIKEVAKDLKILQKLIKV